MLTNKEIEKQMSNGNINLSNLRKKALEKPNSCIVSLGDTLYTYDYCVVDTKEKNNYFEEVNTGIVDRLKQVKIPKDGLLLEPRKVYLAKTNEKVKTSGYIPVLNGITSLSLLGLSVELNSGLGYDNYDGSFLISIVATKPTIIYPNIEIGNLTFFQSLDSKSDAFGMLSGEEIKRRMAIGDLVITPDDNIVINPNSVNLSLNKNIAYYTDPILDLNKKNPTETVEIGENGIVLDPRVIYLAKTNEWTETKNLIPMMSGRSSLGRVGLYVHCSGGMGSIGYKGHFHLGIRPTHFIRIYENMKCCQIYYFTPEGEIANTYNGTMQNLKNEELGSQYYKKMSNNR